MKKKYPAILDGILAGDAMSITIPGFNEIKPIVACGDSYSTVVMAATIELEKRIDMLHAANQPIPEPMSEDGVIKFMIEQHPSGIIIQLTAEVSK